MRLLARLILIPIAAIVVAFAVANRTSVAISLWPLAFDDLRLPLFVVALGSLALGIVIGGLIASLARLGHLRPRADKAARRRMMAAAEGELPDEAVPPGLPPPPAAPRS
jgi:uncharacterized integral membrane protein